MKYLKFVVIVILVILSVSVYLFINKENKKIAMTSSDLINIQDLSEEFMNDYFDGIEKLNKQNNKENILIVSSKERIKDDYGATDIVEAPNNQYFLQYENKEKKDKALNKFKSNPSISVSENIKQELLDNTVLLFNYNSWGVESMGIDTLLAQAKDMELNNVVVAIVDSGLDVELFNEKYPNRLLATYNVLDSSTDVTDNVGHGTHIAGTIAEATPDNVKILVVKTSNSNIMYTADNIAGINYITYGKKADVINMSFGSEISITQEYSAINAAKNIGIIPVAAAGNNGSDAPFYPASYSNTISIAAVNSNKEKADFSNYGDNIMFSAPGVNILSINGTKSGTSMAAPHAVSAVSILKSMNSELEYTDVVTLLRKHSEDLGDEGWDENYGYGFINFTNASLCNNIECDEYNVFTKNDNNDELVELVDNYEIIPTLTEYNYFNNTNIMGTIVRLNYKNGKVVEYKLSQVDDLVISNYDYETTNEQTINIELTTPLGYTINDSFTISNPANYETVWKYNVLNDNDIEITGLKDNTSFVTTLIIPEQIEGYNVVAIADGENTIFEDSWNLFKNVRNLYLPATLTKIGKNAFYNKNLIRTNLNYVKSEAEYIEVMDNAFKSSEALFTIDANISYIGDYAFYFTASLSEINFDSSLNHIGDYAFYGSYNEFTYNKIVIPSTINEFGEGVFMASSLNEVEFLNDIEVLPKNTFKLSDVNKVIINTNVIEIDTNAFEDCKKLNELSLPSSLTTIASSAFKGAFDNATIVIPENVTTIGSSAFENSGLKSISLPNSNLQEIGDYAFKGSTQLENITIPSSVIDLGTEVFASSGLKKAVLNINVEELPIKTFKDSNLLEEVILSNNINTIGDYAFEGCSKLKNINLTNNLLKIGFRAFSKAFDSNESITLIVPESVINISNYAFYQSGLKKVVLNDNTKKIPNGLFNDSKSLEEVIISDKTTTIGDYAFQSCTKLKNINLTVNLLEIGKKAFYGAFDNNENIKLKIPKNVINIDESAFESSYINEVEFLTDNLELIPKNAFSNSPTLEKVILSENIKNIGENAFYHDSSLNKVYLNSNIENISENAFDFGPIEISIKPHLIFYVYSNSVGKTYASSKVEDNEDYTITYVQIDPDITTVKNIKNTYYAFEEVNDISLELTYNEENIRTESINDNIEIQYQNNNDSLRFGDTSIKIIAYNSNNYKIEKNIDITVLKATPTYTVPTALTAKIGQTLSKIELPEGFEWMNENEIITETGSYLAKYTPEDTNNYEIVENIEININVETNNLVVTFDSNGGTGTMDNQQIPSNTDTQLIKNTFTRDGFTFKEWNTKSDGTGTSYNDEQTINISENLTLYAIWKETYDFVINKYYVDENNKYISNIMVNTQVNTFTSYISLNYGYGIDVDTKTINNKQVLYTGGKTKITHGLDLYKEYTNIVMGDTNGDGKLNYLDYVKVYNHIQKTKHPELNKDLLINEFLLAGDMSEDNKISYLDYVSIYNKIKELKGGTN